MPFGVASGSHRQHIDAQFRQLCDDWLGQILVREETSHGSRGLVLDNLLFDEVGVTIDECPGGRQVIRPQRRVCTKEIRLAGTLPSCLLEDPNWNPRAHDPRSASADLRDRLDAGKRITKVTRYPAQQPRLFNGRQAGDQLLHVLEARHQFRLPRWSEEPVPRFLFSHRARSPLCHALATTAGNATVRPTPQHPSADCTNSPESLTKLVQSRAAIDVFAIVRLRVRIPLGSLLNLRLSSRDGALPRACLPNRHAYSPAARAAAAAISAVRLAFTFPSTSGWETFPPASTLL